MTTIERSFILGGEHYDVNPTSYTAAPAPKPEATDEEKASSMPAPSGFKLLCMVPDVAQKFEGTELLRPDALLKAEEHGTTVLFVLKAGPDAYTDKTRYPSGPWCKPGDFVLVRTYSGTRFKIYGKEFRLINEDQVEAVVADPRGITRA